MESNQYQRAAKIKAARISKGLKQLDLARLLGKTISAVSSYELGTRTPKLDDAKRLCDILGLNLEDLVWGEKEDEAE